MKIPKTVERAAAILFFGVITGHPFVDGNKRTASTVLETFLKNNGKELVANDEEIWDAVHKFSENSNLDAVESWIVKNMK